MYYYTKYTNNYCFSAIWISPVTGKRCTALHFSSHLDCIKQLYK